MKLPSEFDEFKKVAKVFFIVGLIFMLIRLAFLALAIWLGWLAVHAFIAGSVGLGFAWSFFAFVALCVVLARVKFRFRG